MISQSCAFILTLLLINSQATVLSEGKDIHPKSDGHFALAYDPPLSINSNQDLLQLANVYGWPGQGSDEDPLIIRSLNISSAGSCIIAHGVSLFFKIENCTLLTSGRFGACIEFSEVSHATVLNCTMVSIVDTTILDMSLVTLSFSPNTAVINCTFLSKSRGELAIYDSANCTVIGNQFSKSGIEIYGTGKSHWLHQIENNTIGHRLIQYVKHKQDQIIDAANLGNIILVECHNLTVRDINISEMIHGIPVAYCTNSTLKTGWIKGAGESSLLLHFSTRIKLKHLIIYAGEFLIEGNTSSHWEHEVNNVTLNSQTLGYFWNINDTDLKVIDYGLLYFAYCESVTVDSGDINNGSTGIKIRQCQNMYFSNISCSQNDRAITIYQSINCTFYNNNITNNRISGIFGTLCRGITVLNSTISHTGGTGIVLVESTDTVIEGNFLSVNSISITMYYSSRAWVMDNTIQDNQMDSVQFFDCIEIEVIRNRLFDDGRTGLLIIDCTDFVLEENVITQSLFQALYLDHCQDGVVRFNRLANTSGHGMRIADSRNLTIDLNLHSGNGIDGIRLEDADYISIRENQIENNSGYGIIGIGCASILIEGNHITQCNGAISVRYLASGEIRGNTIQSNYFDGINLLECEGAIVTENIIYGQILWDGIEGSGLWNCSFNDNIVTHNFVGICLDSSQRVSISGGHIENNEDGVVLTSTSWSIVEDCVVHNSSNLGLYLLETSHCEVRNTSLTYSGSHGVSIRNSLLLNLTDCSIISNNESGVILSNSQNIIITDCEISNNGGSGILMEEVHQCTLHGNKILRNSDGGIIIDSGASNLIILNEIGWNNYTNGMDSGFNNTWDGNFWSDYSGFGVYPISGNASNYDNHPQYLRSEYILDGQLLRVVFALGLFVLGIIMYTVIMDRKDVDEQVERNPKEGESDREERRDPVSPD